MNQTVELAKEVALYLKTLLNEGVNDYIALQLALVNIAAGESHIMICGRCDLGRPPLLETSDQVPAGALFFVLESKMAAQRSYYGELQRTGDGQIAFNKESIPDLTALARKCNRVIQPSS